MKTDAFVHPSAFVEPGARLGRGARVWDWAKVRNGASIGEGTSLGQGVYIDEGVKLGDGCKVQNGVFIYRGVHIGHQVFIGPGVTFTNDRVPRAFNAEWEIVETFVEDKVSIGANATVVCGVRLGRACMVGAGAVVTRDVPDFGLVLGNPARLTGYVDLQGRRLENDPARGRPSAATPE